MSPRTNPNHETKEQRVIAPIAAVVITALLLAPQVKWALQDQAVWHWDEAHYASHALKLFRATMGGIAEWAVAMEHASPGRPPLMVWAGQLFVPLRHLTGDVESALLLLNLFWDGLVFWLVYIVSRRLGAGSIEALAALVACGASGIFIGLNHYFLVETSQCAAAAIMMFAAFRIETRSWLAALSVIVIAVVMGVLSKASSITFVVPLLGYAILVLFVTRSRPKPVTGPGDLLLVAVACGAVLASVAWYRENLFLVTQHLRDATSGDWALNWGSEVHLGQKLPYWTSTLGKSLSPFLMVPLAAGAIIVWAVVVSAIRLRRRKISSLIETTIDNGSLFALTLFGTVCATLLSFSLQINEESRYLLPAIPMIAVLIGWALSVLQIRYVSVAMVGALTAGGLINHSFSFGYNPIGVSHYSWLHPIENDPTERQFLTTVVRATCHDGNDGRWNVIAVSYTWLNNSSAAFSSDKEALLGSRPCAYVGVERETDTAHAMDTILSIKPRYVITVSAEMQHQMEAAGEPKFANVVSLSLAEALARDPRFARTPESNNSVLIYQPIAEVRAGQ